VSINNALNTGSHMIKWIKKASYIQNVMWLEIQL